MASKLQEARAEARAAGGRIAKAFNAVIGARVTAAAALMLVIAFGMTLAVAPDRLPPIGGLSLAQVGLPPLEFGFERQVAIDIGGAAERQGAGDAIGDLLARYPQAIPWLNLLGLVGALAVLVVGVRIQMRQHRSGIAPL